MLVFADDTLARLAASRARAAGAPNPFSIGRANVARYFGVLHECLQAALARPEPAATKLAQAR